VVVLRTERHVAERLLEVQATIAAAAARAGRRPEEITLVAVSKTHPAEAIEEAFEAGVRHFGENRVQEAAEKFPLVQRFLVERARPHELKTDHRAATPVLGLQPDSNRSSVPPAVADIVWHMVGHLQSNKAGQAAGLFGSIDSVDSLHLAQALSRRVVSSGGPDLRIRLEVYVGDDSRRPGLRADELLEVASEIVELPGLRVEGLMTVAPLGGDARAAFSQVRELKLKLSQRLASVHFGVLSMGMSEDYSLAIQEGSTEVRIGTALFGPRQPR
jgi:PLP dependent protein